VAAVPIASQTKIKKKKKIEQRKEIYADILEKLKITQTS
jgi:hypothetical protein